jgi:hypothetical protein
MLFSLDTKYTRIGPANRAFLKSGMRVQAANMHGIYNVTLLGGCRRFGRRKVGVIGDEFFQQNFGAMINETVRKYVL